MNIMSIMRKGFTAFLFLLLLVAARTAFAERSGEYRYRVLGDGTAEITECTSKSKLIEIPSELDGRVVSSLGDQSFYLLHNVEEIRVPDSIRRIGDYVFSNCYDRSESMFRTA